MRGVCSPLRSLSFTSKATAMLLAALLAGSLPAAGWADRGDRATARTLGCRSGAPVCPKRASLGGLPLA